MLPSLLVAAAVTAPAAPVPRDTVPNTSGPAPRVAAVKADASGVVWITAHTYTKQKVQQQIFVVENGKQVLKQQEVEQVVSNYIRKPIGDFGGKFATADGTPLSTEEANRRVKDGATLLITADGKPVDKGWLKAVSGDTVVMTAEGLGHAHFVSGNDPYPSTAAPRLAMLGTDENGTVRLPVNPNVNPGNGGVYYEKLGGARVVRGGQVWIEDGTGIVPGVPATPTTTPPGPDGKKALADVKFDAYDTTGKLIPRADALNRLKAGGLAILAGDTRFPDANYLKAFRDDLVVLVSGELVFPANTPNPYDAPVEANPAPAKPVPGAKPVPVQVLPAVGPAVIKRVQIDK